MSAGLRWRPRIPYGILGIMIACAPVQAQVQDSPPHVPNWGLWDAIGYGGLGFALAMPMAQGSNCIGPCGNDLVSIAALAAGGVIAGAIVGGRARGMLRQSRELSPGHRAAVAVGAVLAGGTFGALASIPLINGEGEGTAIGSDEQTVLLFALGGAALGVLFVSRKWDGLTQQGFNLAPVLLDGTRVGLGVHMDGR